MPTAIIQRPQKKSDGRAPLVSTTKTVTHNNARLYHESGFTGEYVGDDASGNRIYRDTQKR